MSDIVGQVKIDFEVIPTYEIYTLIVADTSDWKYLVNNEATIGIKVPNSSKEILQTFIKKGLNVFNSNNLGISCLVECGEQEYVPIPDGIYTLKLYSSSQYKSKERWFFKTDNLQLEIDKAFVKLGTQYNKENDEVIKDLLTIQFFVDETHAATRIGEQIVAQRNFEIAQELLKKYQDCKNCY
jgi:hypothetical protein